MNNTIKKSLPLIGLFLVGFVCFAIYENHKFKKDVEKYCKESYQVYFLGSTIVDGVISTWSSEIGKDYNRAMALFVEKQEAKGHYIFLDSLVTELEKSEMAIESNCFGDKDTKTMTMDIHSQIKRIVKMGKNPSGSLMNYSQGWQTTKTETDAAFTKLYIKAGVPECMADSAIVDAARLLVNFDIDFSAKCLNKIDKVMKEGQQRFREKYPKCEMLPEGVMYHIVEEGHGSTIEESDSPTITYVCQLENGTIVDQSDYPVRIDLGKSFDGMRIALLKMPIGSSWVVFIPNGLAYGKEGSGPVPPYSNLIMDIKLVSKD